MRNLLMLFACVAMMLSVPCSALADDSTEKLSMTTSVDVGPAPSDIEATDWRGVSCYVQLLPRQFVQHPIGDKPVVSTARGDPGLADTGEHCIRRLQLIHAAKPRGQLIG